jgi:hypothetical protein
MPKINLDEVSEYIEQHIGSFHAKRLEKLESLKYKHVLKHKNPYLFKAKNLLTAHDLVKSLLDAFLQSQEETLFGEFMEELAIFVCGRVFGGAKSREHEGVDLEFVKNGVYYLVEVKSGFNWGNASQIKKMKDHFKEAIATLQEQEPTAHIVAVNGCCYGMQTKPDKGDYFKYCGQEFWELISDSSTLYTDFIEPFGHKAKERNEAFLVSYSKVINTFTLKFAQDFCDDGSINWRKIVEFNSQKPLPKTSKSKKRT